MDPPECRPLEGLEALFACFHERLGDLTTCSATRIDGLSKLPTKDIEVRAKAVIKSLVLSRPLLRSTVRLDDAGEDISLPSTTNPCGQSSKSNTNKVTYLGQSRQWKMRKRLDGSTLCDESMTIALYTTKRWPSSCFTFPQTGMVAPT